MKKENNINVDFSDLIRVFDNLIKEKYIMSDGVTDTLRDSNRARLNKIVPADVANRMRELMTYINEYNGHKRDLELLGWSVIERNGKLEIYKKMEI